MNRLPQRSWIWDDDVLNEEVLEAIQVGQNKSRVGFIWNQLKVPADVKEYDHYTKRKS